MAYNDYGLDPTINPWTGLPYDQPAQPAQPTQPGPGQVTAPTNAPGYQDLNYWAGQGVGSSDIFDTNTGQINPGWLRTGNGYEKDPNYNPSQPTAPPPPSNGGAPSNGNLFNLGQPGTLTAPFTTPFGGLPTLPNLTLPSFRQADPFRATTGADVEADPAYAWEKNQGITGVQQAAASKGLLNSGGTLKDISQWTTDYANTKLNDVNARRLQDYATNYQTQTLDPYRFAYQSALDAYSPLMSQYQNQSNLALPLWQQQFGVFKDQRDSTWSKAAQVLTS